ncbi:MAG: IS66 family insertion sequence element accessory protein TnpB [Colwellia sp.]|nr:IS66 family insertion sequence element accessory protein TnpB [Colwellia sp.]
MHSPQTVYFVTGFTDMRKSINGLSIIVSETLSLDPLSQLGLFFVINSAINLKYYFEILMVFGFIIVA